MSYFAPSATRVHEVHARVHFTRFSADHGAGLSRVRGRPPGPVVDLETSNKLRRLIEDDMARAHRPLRILADAAGISEQTIYAVVGARAKCLSVSHARRLLSAESVEKIIDLATFEDRCCMLPSSQDPDLSESSIIRSLILQAIWKELKARRVRIKAATADAIRDSVERAIRVGHLRLPEPDPDLERRFAELEASYISAVTASRAKRRTTVRP